MSKSQPVTQNQTQTTSIPAWLTNYAKSAGQEGANLPDYTPYTGSGVAGLSPDQLQALGIASSNVGAAGNVATSGMPAANALTGFNIPGVDAGSLNPQVAALMSPYTQNVVDTTNRQLDQNTATAVNNSDNQFAAQHAFGGDRQGVADAVIRNQADLTKASTDAGLYQGGYNNALTTALAALQGNQGASANAANVRLGGVNALTGMGGALSGINTADLNSLLTAGGAQQQTQTAQNQFGYNQYLNQFQLPDQQAQAFASILGSLPHSTTQTGQTSSMAYSNPLMGLAGLGLGIAGLGTGGGATLGGTALSSGGSALSSAASALPGLLAILSDRSTKKDIKQVGMLFDGTPVYRFRYIRDGDGPMQIGLMAQDVERTTPEAVQEIEGVKFVNYEKATELAVAMSGER